MFTDLAANTHHGLLTLLLHNKRYHTRGKYSAVAHGARGASILICAARP